MGQECFLCGDEVEYGEHQYDGTWVQGYQMFVCNTCFESNWDGWAPHYEEIILEHLREQGIAEPSRNENGLLPRSYE